MPGQPNRQKEADMNPKALLATFCATCAFEEVLFSKAPCCDCVIEPEEETCTEWKSKTETNIRERMDVSLCENCPIRSCKYRHDANGNLI